MSDVVLPLLVVCLSQLTAAAMLLLIFCSQNNSPDRAPAAQFYFQNKPIWTNSWQTHLCMLTLLTVTVTENGSEVIRKLYLLHNKAITRTESYSFHGPRWPQQLDDVLWGTSNVCRLVTKILGNCWMPRSRRWIWMTLFQEDPPAGVSGAPTENNIMLWNAVIFGPHETPFEVRPDPTTTPQYNPHRSLAYHNT